MKTGNHRGLGMISFLLLAFLYGCDGEVRLYSNLEEIQANGVMAALLDNGIGCQKSAGEEGTWNLTIAQGDFARAAAICEEKGLPRRKYVGVGEVFKKSGMVSSPSEERIRFMDATAQDIAKTIAMIDGVIDARVHIVLPENDPFAKNTLPSSVAVAVRSRWDADLTDQTAHIKSLVKNSIEGLKYEKITVTIFKDQPPRN